MERLRKRKTKLLVSTAWNPQKDGLSERRKITTATVEIAIRYLIAVNPNVSWVDILPSLQHNLNYLLFLHLLGTLYKSYGGHSPILSRKII